MSSPSTGRIALLAVGLFAVIGVGVTAGLVGPVDAPGETQSIDTDALKPALAQVNGTANYLQVSDEDLRTSGRHQASVDVTAATRIDSDQLALDYALESFQVRFERAETETERTAAARTLAARLDNKTEAVHQRQQRALERYNDGELTPNEFMATLARVDAAAEEIEATADTVIMMDESTIDYSLPPDLETKLRGYEGALLTNSGLIREVEFQPAIVGSGRSRLAYIETGERGIVVATIVNDRYVREGFTTSPVLGGGEPRLRTASEVVDRASELYPWAMAAENRKRPPRPDSFGNTSVFSVDISHTQGELTTYLDTSTTDVFKEEQIRDLSAMTVSKTYTNSTGRFALTVNATHDTGPIEISLTRLTTNSGANATVEIDGRRVGETGDDGLLWTLDTRGTTTVEVRPPERETFTVTIPDGAIPG
mgnify:CR=1 FL=1